MSWAVGGRTEKNTALPRVIDLTGGFRGTNPDSGDKYEGSDTQEFITQSPGSSCALYRSRAGCRPSQSQCTRSTAGETDTPIRAERSVDCSYLFVARSVV